MAMSRLRKYGRIALAILAVLVAVQVGVSVLVKTRPMRGFLVAHLESAFGRPVNVETFSIQILPIPQLDVEGVTIGEDPAFGQEYFLRAERMTASLRWMGLLRGRFQFGTMSLTRPSLILVRNAEGRWNLEGWLPPARLKSAGSAPGGPSQAPVETTHRLQKIEFDEGRINFKTGEEKRPFAFIGVSGSVEQLSEGRWRLRLEAEPWRSGVALQSTGTLQVVGDLAGTSARLQPAQIRLHWENVSLADLFRLVTGNDSGVRGEFALDGNASVSSAASEGETKASAWRFELQARATQIHRWDLTERADNPRINVNLKGAWNVAGGEARVEELRVELPRSNLEGSGVLQTAGAATWRAQFSRVAIEAEDLLAWYRAFQPGVAEQVGVSDFLSGNLSAGGWPFHWEDGVIVSEGGTLRTPELQESRIDPFRASFVNGVFSMVGVRLKLGADAAAPGASARVASGLENSVELKLYHHSWLQQEGASVTLHLTEAERLLKLTSAFGRRLDQGWEYRGGANGFFQWERDGRLKTVLRSGRIDLTKSWLAIAGLNQPLKIEDSRLDWSAGRRTATIGKAEAFGASWSGTISEIGAANAEEQNGWRFQLHADHLDAAELDRWFGPRARPNWLQRLLTSLRGESNASGRASELLRRVSAEGELSTDSLTVEGMKLTNARALLTFGDLRLEARNVAAEWAGGNVRGEVRAVFSPRPSYAVNVETENVNLTQFPWPSRWAERWSGTASGKLELSTGGVGRQELLKHLAGRGEVKLSKVELRGWDIPGSVDSGILRTGTSRWWGGEGRFEIAEQQVRFDGVRLEGGHGRIELLGTVGFDLSGDLSFLPEIGDRRSVKIAPGAREFSLSGPLETPKAIVRPATVAATRP